MPVGRTRQIDRCPPEDAIRSAGARLKTLSEEQVSLKRTFEVGRCPSEDKEISRRPSEDNEIGRCPSEDNVRAAGACSQQKQLDEQVPVVRRSCWICGCGHAGTFHLGLLSFISKLIGGGGDVKYM